MINQRPGGAGRAAAQGPVVDPLVRSVLLAMLYPKDFGEEHPMHCVIYARYSSDMHRAC